MHLQSQNVPSHWHYGQSLLSSILMCGYQGEKKKNEYFWNMSKWRWNHTKFQIISISFIFSLLYTWFTVYHMWSICKFFSQINITNQSQVPKIMNCRRWYAWVATTVITALYLYTRYITQGWCFSVCKVSKKFGKCVKISCFTVLNLHNLWNFAFIW